MIFCDCSSPGCWHLELLSFRIPCWQFYGMDLKFLSLTISLISIFSGYSYCAMLLSLVLGVHTRMPLVHSYAPIISLCLLLCVAPRFRPPHSLFLPCLQTSSPWTKRTPNKTPIPPVTKTQFVTSNLTSGAVSLEGWSGGCGWLVRLSFRSIPHPEPPSSSVLERGRIYELK